MSKELKGTMTKCWTGGCNNTNSQMKQRKQVKMRIQFSKEIKFLKKTQTKRKLEVKKLSKSSKKLMGSFIKKN